MLITALFSPIIELYIHMKIITLIKELPILTALKSLYSVVTNALKIKGHNLQSIHDSDFIDFIHTYLEHSRLVVLLFSENILTHCTEVHISLFNITWARVDQN